MMINPDKPMDLGVLTHFSQTSRYQDHVLVTLVVSTCTIVEACIINSGD